LFRACVVSFAVFYNPYFKGGLEERSLQTIKSLILPVLFVYKQTIVIRADLKMGKGKLAAQSSHASLGAYKKVQRLEPEIVRSWENEGQMKVVLKVKSEEELLEYYNKGKAAGIPCELIRDAGHTQVEPGTITCFCAGPWKESELDAIFGNLKLL
jgi:PTH2 family peptidyl-tRNA hydrolase